MKLIIDIDEDVYKLFTGNGQGIKVVRFNLENTLKNGTPLEEELEKIRDEIRNFDLVSTNGNSAENVFLLTRDLSASVIERHISELKGENK